VSDFGRGTRHDQVREAHASAREASSTTFARDRSVFGHARFSVARVSLVAVATLALGIGRDDRDVQRRQRCSPERLPYPNPAASWSCTSAASPGQGV